MPLGEEPPTGRRTCGRETTNALVSLDGALQ